ncbi:MAG: HlyD family efflux transporter periplasmic adaptor subunit [Pseudomonadota bacterium]
MLKSKWVFFVPVIIAIVALIVLKQNKKQPIRTQAKERATHVRIIKVPSVAVIPQAIGYGTVQPASNWQAISQVQGKVIYKEINLKKGSILAADKLLLKIDPTDYQISIAQTQADIAAIEAQLSELDIKKKNTRLSLAIEQQSLKLIKKELQRQKQLSKKGGISFSDVEKQERNYLAQQQSVQNQHNTLSLIPTQKALLDAQLLRQQAQMKSLQRDLANTQISLPFSGRIAEVNIEENQYIREGELLAVVDSLDKAEVEVQLSIVDMGSILHTDKIISKLDKLQLNLPIQAEVILKLGNNSLRWAARFARLSDTLDPKTRTVGVIVEVDKPYSNIQPGTRPPLVKGLFVQVKLTGQLHENSIIVPNSALHNASHNSEQKIVYLVNRQGRLETRKVKIKIKQDEYSVVDKKVADVGLEEGEKLIISDLLPAIENMLLTSQEDKLLSQYIIQQATNSYD